MERWAGGIADGGDRAGSGDDGSGGARNFRAARRLGVGRDKREPVTGSAEGNVTQVSATATRLLLNLAAGDSFIRCTRGTRRECSSSRTWRLTRGISAMTQLKGRAAKITFVTVAGKTYDGEIQWRRSSEVEQIREQAAEHRTRHST